MEAKRDRDALEEEKRRLRFESAKVQEMTQALAREKAILDTSRNCLQDERKDLEDRVRRLEEAHVSGKASLEDGRKELKMAAELLEREKDALKAAKKVWCMQRKCCVEYATLADHRM